ncbi:MULTISPECIES: acetate/propionate family kinase [Megasphaera]|uniref:Acetate kinase n=2 Tax=Megasphaera hutchinsoni TaxID=1588748 RepID=A0A2J8BCK8_9FIRM|nr:MULTISPECIES: acetate kinase [Megasphaera]EGS32657.1 acetate kinase [Megasphaera sp. UPII 135-E]MUP48742.1 acetate kinase [Veillonellaceae bacterium M2-8]MUP59233.1 acetate kinase [Veillonellaceae bacterium M2-4]PNH22514.1 acetate kinase [Megasphaera genomosp. type_2]
MIILVVNCGSSSLKYQLIDMKNEEVMAKGLVERIGLAEGVLTHKWKDQKKVINQPIPDHNVAVQLVLNILTDKDCGVITSMDAIDAVGHRVVHGGEKFACSTLITDEVMQALDECVDMAPLHNPPNIIGIKACQAIMPNVVQVGVFDTAFHQTMPAKAFMYGVPYEFYKEDGIRRYGFHGTSHRYVAGEVARVMGVPVEKLRIINCHLGNGSSLAAIKYGKSVDTTMGFTPLPGVLMGTRCGDIDPAIVLHEMERRGLSAKEMDTIMNKKSGVLGISGVSSDFRDLGEAAANGNERAKLALDMFHYQVQKAIGALAAAMEGVDVITFTAGVGENGIEDRAGICRGLAYLGAKLDEKRNDVRGKNALISTDDSTVKLYVIPTNEEIMIARDTRDIVSQTK